MFKKEKILNGNSEKILSNNISLKSCAKLSKQNK